MKVHIIQNQCIVEREPGDPRFRDSEWGSGESRLLYHIKKALSKQGYDLIKKRMAKDGHLVSDDQLYLRTRKPSGNPDQDIYIYNANWQITGADNDFNESGKVILTVVTNVFKKD